ncbi:MAG: hypothetical protein PHH26_01675 [Candidatus Thermoplasmatota archaeon]|jgi:hypothetical protein|nr:hypothetical protein [Dehalococcoidia bacterium]MDD5502153.1 hypothetical protein [Candidatus Thermoplasmatota archaeon]
MTPDIEKQVETGIRSALRSALDAAERPAVPIHAFWLKAEEMPEESPAMIPGIFVRCAPYLPASYESALAVFPAGRCIVEVRVRVNPTDDKESVELNTLWSVVRDTIYRGAYTFTGGISLAGQIIQDSISGLDESGAYAAVTVEVAVNVG